MMSGVKPIPDGYHTVTPYLVMKDAASAIAFYEKAFGAKKLMVIPSPHGRIGHAEIKIGDSPIMMADESPEMHQHSPQSLGGSPVSLLIYIEDVDALAAQAIAAGIKVVSPVEEKFYGDRIGTFADPFGYVWHLATHVKNVSAEDMQKYAAACSTEKEKAGHSV